MKTIILLITLVLCNLSFGCVILPNGNYIPCDTNITEIIVKKSFKQRLSRLSYDKDFFEKIEKVKTNIENVKTNIEYNVKLAESRLNEAEVKYVESIKKYKTTLHNDDSGISKQKVYSDIAKQKVYSDIAKLKLYSEMIIAKQQADYEMLTAKQNAYSEMIFAKFEYETARWECGRIYALAKGESIYSKVGKSPREIFELVK